MVKNGQEFENFSKRLYGFLTMKGFRYERCYKHLESGKKCWVYLMTDELSAALQEWKNNNPNKSGK